MRSDYQEHTFHISPSQHPDASAFGTFKVEAFPVTRIDSDEIQGYQYTVLYAARRIVAYSGPFSSLDEAFVEGLKAMWVYVETGENADPIAGLAATVERMVGVLRGLVGEFQKMMRR